MHLRPNPVPMSVTEADKDRQKSPADAGDEIPSLGHYSCSSGSGMRAEDRGNSSLPKDGSFVAVPSTLDRKAGKERMTGGVASLIHSLLIIHNLSDKM